jgi:E3 ubiquitin-protein ligase RNF38/44
MQYKIPAEFCITELVNAFSLQNALVMYHSRTDEVGHVDEHSDMRLDVDNMTYEVRIFFRNVDLCNVHHTVCAYMCISINSFFFFVFTLQELVALEEQIGDVNTGLSESYIQENLRSSFYIPGAACMSDQTSELSVESDACIICQVSLLPCSLLNYI